MTWCLAQLHLQQITQVMYINVTDCLFLQLYETKDFSFFSIPISKKSKLETFFTFPWLCNRLKFVNVLHERSCKSVLWLNAFKWIWEPLWLSSCMWLTPPKSCSQDHDMIMCTSCITPFPSTNYIKDGTCTRGVANQVIAWCGEPITVWHVRMYS